MGLVLLFDSREGGGHSVLLSIVGLQTAAFYDFFLSTSATLSYINLDRKLLPCFEAGAFVWVLNLILCLATLILGLESCVVRQFSDFTLLKF